MTVIDVFLERPSVVLKHKEISTRNRKRKSSAENNFMPEIQGCTVSNILAEDSQKIFSMETNRTDPEINEDTELIKGKEKNTSSSLQLKKQKILVKTNRTPVRSRRKSRWKLKFHHQALPPEYLRHYKQQERKRRQNETHKSGNIKNSKKKSLKKSVSDNKEGSERISVNCDTSEVAVLKMDAADKSEDWSKGTDKQKAVQTSHLPIPLAVSKPSEEKTAVDILPSSLELNLRCRSTEELLNNSLSNFPHLNIDVSQNKAFLENLLTNQIEINRVEQKNKKTTDVKSSLSHFNKLKNIKHEDRHKSYSIPPSGKIMNYSDLPYMGEITLDGIKPRRGRKPKKADICHLIYKNYGQVFPGAPGKNLEEGINKKKLKWRTQMGQSFVNSSQGTKERLGSPGSAQEQRSGSPLPTVPGLINHTEVQNRIINSLLEKRLTQGVKFKNYLSKDKDEPKPNLENEEPLNLCLRDLQSLKIKLSRKHGNIYETKQKESETEVKIKTEMEDDEIKTEVINIDKSESEIQSSEENEDENDEEDDLAPFNLVTTELRESSDDDTFLNFNDQITLTKVKSQPNVPETKDAYLKSKVLSADAQLNPEPNSLLFWPADGFLPAINSQPLFCYPKTPSEISNSVNFGFGLNKRASPLAETKSLKNKGEGHRTQLKRLAPNAKNTKPAHVITKRKRSAIFIPPVPAESTTNPTTEVSICKFKFTGGAKPSLQEKKMLSVDSGGNFRYYSGTGDKSMRGYEYFPRESLQQCQENTGCSPSGVFLTASALGSGEKIPEEIGHSGFFDPDFSLQVPIQKENDQKNKLTLKYKKLEPKRKMSDTTSYQTLRDHLLRSKSESSEVSIIPEDLDRDDGNSSDQSADGFDMRNISQSYFDSFRIQEESSRMSSKSDESSLRNKKLRKTRKSLAREKLEQTFKEKGFLIQTQQLESAEGATYCKFRQLRKFTRYLFRSWKDYLPGNVRNLSVDAGVENPETAVNIPEPQIKMEALGAEGSSHF